MDSMPYDSRHVRPRRRSVELRRSTTAPTAARRGQAGNGRSSQPNGTASYAVRQMVPLHDARAAAWFAGRQVVILGLARQGLALARFFVGAGARVTVSDLATPDKLEAEIAALANLPVDLALGEHPLALLDGCDLLCLSGGVPPQTAFVAAARGRGIPLSNDSLLTLQMGKALGLGPMVGITGSSGKTTTTTLVGKMLAASGIQAQVGGNIGAPLLDQLHTLRPLDPLVLELSSFQLELFDPALAWGDFENLGPDVAAILNITPNHLDRHPSMADYTAAKLNLVRHMPAGATLVVNVDDPVVASLAPELRPAGAITQPPEWALESLLTELHAHITATGLKVVGYSRTTPLAHGAWLDGETLMLGQRTICRRSEVRLRGDHNIGNILAAAAISTAAGATIEGIRHVVRTFTGVAHRLEVVAQRDGVTWINDSIATSPERAIAGLRSFPAGKQTLILLAGGKDKNLPWDAFALEVPGRVSFLIGFGQSGPMIVNVVQERARFSQQKAPNCAVVRRLDEAVELAARIARPNSVVLLSPGGTSYDAYRNFEERGEHFRQLVQRTLEVKTAAAIAVQENGAQGEAQ